MIIEKTTIIDLRSIAELKKEMFTTIGFGHLLNTNFEHLVVEDYQQMYSNNKAMHHVIRHGNSIVAMAGSFIKSDIPYRYFRNNEYGFIGDVYTIPQARNQGYASALSSAAIDWLKRQNVSSVRLLASDQAEPIYTSMGFQRTTEMCLYLNEDAKF